MPRRPPVDRTGPEIDRGLGRGERRCAERHRALRTPAAAAAFAAALTGSYAPGVSRAQTPPPDLVAELASKVAGAISSAGPTQVAIDAADIRVREAIASQLHARGIAVESGASTTIHAACAANLRERVCTAEIADGPGPAQVVSAVRARDGASLHSTAISVELDPLLMQREPMLDVAPVGELLAVLEPERVSLHARPAAPGAQSAPIAAAPLPANHAWPRDVRGRLRATPAGFEVFLPGLFCRGRLNPVALACSESDAAWPLGLDNAGIVANRNYFTTPEGRAFYGAAALGDSGGRRWLIADQQGALTFLDASRTAVAHGDPADDVVRVETACGGGTHVIVAALVRESHADRLRLLQVEDLSLTEVAERHVEGTLTALWAEPDGGSVRAIVRSPTQDRYEAFRVAVACAR